MITNIKEVEKRLLKLGYERKKHINCHVVFSKQGHPNVIIPKRKGRDLIKPTYFSILKQLGMNDHQFKNI